MATLRNKRKLAAVSRETPEGNRGSRGRNVLDPELTQDYITQVSEEIEGRVTKKLSKKFKKTESRILGALSKLDEFILNPQVRTCSVVQGAKRNANSENRETHGDLSLNDPYPEGGYFQHHSGQLNSPEAEMVAEPYSHNSSPFIPFTGFVLCPSKDNRSVKQPRKHVPIQKQSWMLAWLCVSAVLPKFLRLIYAGKHLNSLPSQDNVWSTFRW